MAKKKTERAKLVAKADTQMSRYIRMSESIDGYCTCVSCGIKLYWKGEGMHMGHFIPKGNGASAVRYLPQNCHPQCSACNCSGGPLGIGHKQGVAVIGYYQWMEAKYGVEIIDDLKARKFGSPFHRGKFSNAELQEIAELYKYFADEYEVIDDRARGAGL